MRFLTIFLVLLSGCGTIYKSPSVVPKGLNSDQDLNVRVIEMTEQSAVEANLSPYTPQRLPAVFSTVASAPALNVSGRAPQPSADASFPPGAPQVFLPSNPPIRPYTIGVSDVVLLATPSAGSTVEQLSGLLAAQNKRQGYTVQDDGAIAIPDIGRIQLSGLTLEEAEAAVFEALVSKNIEPSFSLEIAEFNSQRATIGGAVRNPTIAPITIKPLYLEEALQLAGGIAPGDLDYTTVRIYRDGVLYQVSARELYDRNNRVLILDNDSVFVDSEYELDGAETYFREQIAIQQLRRAERTQALAELEAAFRIRSQQLEVQRENFQKRLELGAVKRQYVYLYGEVKKQGRFPLPFETTATLADALFSQGGISTREADVSQIYVLRRSTDPREFGARTAYHLNGQDATNILTATIFQLRPNDVVFVSEQPVTVWNRVIAQITPALISAGVNATSN